MNDHAHPATSDHAVTLDPENPWLGLFSYTEETRAFFHGRDEEAAELARRVQHKLLTVLFGQSGLGKTSLLRAGLVPRLRKEGYCPVYVRIDYAAGSPVPSAQIRQAIFRTTLDAGHWTRPGASAEDDTLWELLHHRGDLLRDADGEPLTPLLIFDQFEEIFTLGQADDAGKQRAQQFLEDLADLVENRAPAELEARMDEDDALAEEFDFGRADYRVLITLREDYLAYLESVKDTMPSITQNRMRLARMNGEQALDAVVKPGGKLVTPEVAEAIVRFVAGGSELQNAEIEPSLLSLVCRELNTIRQTQGRKEISTDLLAGSRETILSEFYERSLADQPEGVRRVIEDELLTESGYRESLAEERVRKALTDAGAAPDALAALVNRRLLRIEDRLDMRRVELTHDVLCSVVLASRNTRREREAREQAERALAEQREREAAIHRTLRRTRMAVGVCIVLLLIAVAGGAFGWYSMHRAQAAEAEAKATRAHAEKLVSFLIEDFYTELKPTGRLATLGKLAQKTVDYYDSLPPDQVTRQTRLNRAMALMRLGSIQLQGGHVDIATKSLDAAKTVFARLRAAGVHGEPVTYGLASLLAAEGNYALNTQVGSTQPLVQSADLLRPLVKGANPSNRVLQLYGDDMGGICLVNGSLSPKKALPLCNESLAALRRVGALKLKDLTAASSWASVAGSKAFLFMQLDRLPEAQKLAEQALTLNEKVLAHRPDDLPALSNATSIADLLAQLADRQHDEADAAAYADMAVQAGQKQVRFDPSSLNAWGAWAYELTQKSILQINRGELAKGIATMRAALAVAKDPRSPKRLAPTMAVFWQNLAVWQALAGNAAGVHEAMQTYASDSKAKLAKLPADSPQRRIDETGVQNAQAEMQLYLGNPQAAFKPLMESIARVEAVKAPTGDTNASYDRNNLLFIGRTNAAFAAVQIGRYVDAEKLARAVLAAPPNPGQNSQVGNAIAHYLLAWAVAKQGRKAEARKALQPALDYYQQQYKAGARGWRFRNRYARALYARAISQPANAAGRKQRQAALDQATKLLAGMTDEAKRTPISRRVSALIAKARTQP